MKPGLLLKKAREENGLNEREVAERMGKLGGRDSVDRLKGVYIPAIERNGLLNKVGVQNPDRFDRYLTALDLTPRQVEELSESKDLEPYLEDYVPF